MPHNLTEAAKLGLSATVLDALRAEFESISELQCAHVFGSRAKGTHRPGSDIDIALFGPELTSQQIFALETRLDDLMLPYEIDLCHVDSLTNQALLEHIRRMGQPIYFLHP